MGTTLFTLGYEGLTIDAFIAELRLAGIDTVLDVREVPISRKKGFSKNAFSIALRNAGIAYSHRPEFGCPKEIRNKYRNDRDWTAYKRLFNAYIKTKASDLASLVKESQKRKLCLVCFEADYNYCHRSLVAKEAGKIGNLMVENLIARRDDPDEKFARAA